MDKIEKFVTPEEAQAKETIRMKRIRKRDANTRRRRNEQMQSGQKKDDNQQWDIQCGEILMNLKVKVRRRNISEVF